MEKQMINKTKIANEHQAGFQLDEDVQNNQINKIYVSCFKNYSQQQNYANSFRQNPHYVFTINGKQSLNRKLFYQKIKQYYDTKDPKAIILKQLDSIDKIQLIDIIHKLYSLIGKLKKHFRQNSKKINFGRAYKLILDENGPLKVSYFDFILFVENIVAQNQSQIKSQQISRSFQTFDQQTNFTYDLTQSQIVTILDFLKETKLYVNQIQFSSIDKDSIRSNYSFQKQKKQIEKKFELQVIKQTYVVKQKQNQQERSAEGKIPPIQVYQPKNQLICNCIRQNKYRWWIIMFVLLCFSIYVNVCPTVYYQVLRRTTYFHLPG